MFSFVQLTLILLVLTASALPRLPALYIRQPGGNLRQLDLDPRGQREAFPAYHDADQGKVSDDSLGTHFKRKSPMFFLQRISAGTPSLQNDTDVYGDGGPKRKRRFLPLLTILGWAAHELMKHIFAAKEQDEQHILEEN